MICNHIKKIFNGNTVLSDVHFHLGNNDKAGIVGKNGAGKTTLFKIIAGEISSDSGEIHFPKYSSFGYLKQNMEINSNYTVYKELLTVFDEVMQIEQKLYLIEQEISKTHSIELTHEYDNLRAVFEQKRGYEYKSLVRGILKGLGFSKDVYDMKISDLSGGQKTRICLAKLLLQQPTLLMLDEPTNHLDIAAIEWLENFLRTYKGTVLIISHDRYFLDKIVNKIIHIEFGKSRMYDGNYDNFIIESTKFQEIAMHHYENQQREINRQKAVIEKLRQFNREKSIKRARSREKMLEKQDIIEKPISDNSTINFSLIPQVISGTDVLSVEDLAMSFDGNQIFNNISLDIKRGEKVAIVGPNGVGKTTLFKIILGKLKQQRGDFYLGANVNVGYYDQEHNTLNNSNTIIEEISSNFPNLKNGYIRNVLATFLFTDEDVFKHISTLSGGEKGRVSFAKIMLSYSNLLLLDEPTNHLDITSKEILERAISNYEGTVIYVSHDRYFINQTATKVLEMNKDGMIVYLGDYDYYIEKKLQNKNIINKPTIQQEKSDWAEQKLIKTNMRKIKTQIDKIEKQIEETELKIKKIDEDLYLPEIYNDFKKVNEYSQKKQELTVLLNNLYEEWELLNM
ncbi:ABC transporter [Candidatus Epulonipiscium fishelsonii]|uniref:ABC transporter n=1 Tax=Candidatus Epulonipiscium fishelsonii TaxID=77094 RepID=A0ACC8XCW5_9FIRM|nr:ABC transporter [Epulopiscium sp. SCG-D08WGA-EpuloA1]